MSKSLIPTGTYDENIPTLSCVVYLDLGMTPGPRLLPKLSFADELFFLFHPRLPSVGLSRCRDQLPGEDSCWGNPQSTGRVTSADCKSTWDKSEIQGLFKGEVTLLQVLFNEVGMSCCTVSWFRLFK
jgi:hypothetical protein